MGNAVLSNDSSPISQACTDVMTKIGIDSWNHASFIFIYSGYTSQEVDCAFKTPSKESGSGEEQVSDGSGLEIECVKRRPRAFSNFKGEM